MPGRLYAPVIYQPLIITTVSLPSGTTGSAYSTTLVASGGLAPYTWSLLSTVPNTGNWLSISSAGVLSGTPTTAETETILCKVQDANGTIATAFLSLSVSAGSSGFLPAGHFVNAVTALDLVYPRPDSETGVNERHRWAYYDGVNPMQYTLRVGIRGGAFPYVWSVSGPSGMTISQWTSNTDGGGTITWTPTGSVTNATVTVTATDQQHNTLTATYTVSTSSSLSHFIFLNADSGSDSNTGAIGSPYKTLAGAFGSTFATHKNGGAIAVLRGATAQYVVPVYADNDFDTSLHYFEMDTTNKPCALIGFPGESPVLDATGVQGFAFFHNAPGWFTRDYTYNGYLTSGVNNKHNYIVGGSGRTTDRMVFQKIAFTNTGYGSSSTDTASEIMSSNGAGNYRLYNYICDCTISNRQTGNIGGDNNYPGYVLYAQQHCLYEYNSINQPSGSFTGPFYMKADHADATARGNTVIIGSGEHACSTGFIQNAASPITRIEICYNHIQGAPLQELTQPASGTGQHWVYRNSVINTHIAPFTPNSDGPYTHNSNAVQASSPQVTPGTQVTDTNTECEGTSGIFDSSGLLTGTARTNFLGLRGAEIA